MKVFLSAILFFACTCFTVHGQTIYKLRYPSAVNGDTAVYDVFFSLSSNGTGFVRIKDPGSKAVIAMDILEQFARDKGITDTTMLLYEGTDPIVVMGDKKTKIPPVTFWFRMNRDNLPDPWGVTMGRNEPVPAKSNFLETQFIRSQDLTKNKDLVLNFFADTSAWYKNYFGPKSKGGSLTAAEKKDTHMFLVIVASTADSTLMPNCLTDARKVVDLFSDIAKNVLGIRFFVDSIYGDRYNKPAVETALKKLMPGKEDIVVFYYSGHGFTDRNYPDKDFPFLDLRDPNKRPRPDARTQTLNIQDIYNTIIQKKARLNLVLSDCCNDTIEAKKKPGTKLPGQKGLTRLNFDNVKALFMNKAPINLLMTAASKDERAIITPSYSSYFTNFFIESLKTYLSPEKGYPTWFQVLGETQKQTRFFAERACCIQTPRLLLPR